MYAIRRSGKLVFECPSPSVWMLVGAHAMLAFTGSCWLLSVMDKQGHIREGQYPKRDEGLKFLEQYFGFK